MEVETGPCLVRDVRLAGLAGRALRGSGMGFGGGTGPCVVRDVGRAERCAGNNRREVRDVGRWARCWRASRCAGADGLGGANAGRRVMRDVGLLGLGVVGRYGGWLDYSTIAYQQSSIGMPSVSGGAGPSST